MAALDDEKICGTDQQNEKKEKIKDEKKTHTKNSGITEIQLVYTFVEIEMVSIGWLMGKKHSCGCVFENSIFILNRFKLQKPQRVKNRVGDFE